MKQQFSSPFGAARAWAMVMAGLLAGAGAAACANAAPYNPAHLSEGQLGQVAQICRSVIRVQPGEEHFDSCVESLSVSLSGLVQSRAIEGARAACLSKGLAPETPQMSECIVESRSGDPAAGVQPDVAGAVPADDVQGLGAGKSYFEVSPDIAYRREQFACARLGLDPADRAFASCVAGLKTGMLAANSTMN